ncbi:MAG: hypothetical protein H7X95_06040 [Deltaproteobacteria bacterium]|nr:hypothetical protein [Deltaproteobacteria bacterium]
MSKTGIPSPSRRACSRPPFLSALSWAILAVAAGIGGCAKTPTVVVTNVMVDGTVSPLLLLNSTVSLDSDPTKQSSASLVSLAKGDAAGQPGPYFFPLELPLSVPPALSGPVTITIEGLDWATGKVIARGTGKGEVVKEQSTRASVTLTAVNPGPSNGSDAGTIDGAIDAVTDGNVDGAIDGAVPDDAQTDL